MFGRLFGWLKSLFIKKRPCYRCGGVATEEYMALRYCSICRIVVVRMMPMIGMGGMFGFPGGSGYLEFPEHLEKKEGQSHG